MLDKKGRSYLFRKIKVAGLLTFQRRLSLYFTFYTAYNFFVSNVTIRKSVGVLITYKRVFKNFYTTHVIDENLFHPYFEDCG